MSGSLNAGAMMSMNQVRIVASAAAGAAKPLPKTPPTAIPIPAIASANRPIDSVPTTGVAMSPPVIVAPIAMPIIAIAVIMRMSTKTPTPPATTHRRRASGVASRSSSRPGGRPAEPDEGAGQAGRRDRTRRADVAADERFHADGHENQGHDCDRHERWPVVDAGQRDVIRRPAEPGEVRDRGEARDDRLVAVEDEATERDRAGDRQRGAAPEELGDREGERPGGER